MFEAYEKEYQLTPVYLKGVAKTMLLDQGLSVHVGDDTLSKSVWIEHTAGQGGMFLIKPVGDSFKVSLKTRADTRSVGTFPTFAAAVNRYAAYHNNDFKLD